MIIEERALVTIQAADILTRYREKVWPLVQQYLVSPHYPRAFDIPPAYRREQDLHWDMIREYPFRQGKYLRPTLLLLTCEALGGNPVLALNTAAAMQISEEWILIHDDLEDGFAMRRGKETLHRMVGPELANNAGDALHAIMWHALFKNNTILSMQKTFAVLEEFFRMICRTIEGQSVELQWALANNTTITDSDCFYLCDGKTGYYSVGGPMRLGAIVSGATDDQLDALAAFGARLGRCYQLIDDILDVTQDFRGLKKQKGNDVYEGKRTILLSHLLRSIDAVEKTRLGAILAKHREEKTEEEVEWVIEKMGQHGSIQHAKNLAQAFRDEAKTIFHSELGFLFQHPARDYLQTLLDFVVERDF